MDTEEWMHPTGTLQDPLATHAAGAGAGTGAGARHHCAEMGSCPAAVAAA